MDTQKTNQSDTKEPTTFVEWAWLMLRQLWDIIENSFPIILSQQEEIQRLRDENAVLKGEKAKPVFKPSGMEEKTKIIKGSADRENKKPPKRPGSAKKHKTQALTIYNEISIKPKQPIPEGSRFKGYRDVVIQDIIIQPNNTPYRLEIWQTPTGEYLCGELPQHLKGSHFGPTLKSFILYQYYQVTQPLLHEQLQEFGVDISKGQVSAILSQNNEHFFLEKDQILQTGLSISNWINVDDTGARHQGKNGYTTHIGNDFFAWFSTTYSKSRINFLELLQADKPCYSINQYALAYLESPKLPQKPLQFIKNNPLAKTTESQQWNQYLDTLGIKTPKHRAIATEGALLGGLIDSGFSLDMAIVSDGAGQFAILRHALCWVHAERLVHKLIPFDEAQREDQQKVRDEIWCLYKDLKIYKETPDPEIIPVLTTRFDEIFTQQTSFETLNQLLQGLHAHKDKLLLVLQHSDIPLDIIRNLRSAQ